MKCLSKSIAYFCDDRWLAPLEQDQKTVAERAWQRGKLAPIAQKPCDHGLFSDDAKQTDMF